MGTAGGARESQPKLHVGSGQVSRVCVGDFSPRTLQNSNMHGKGSCRRVHNEEARPLDLCEVSKTQARAWLRPTRQEDHAERERGASFWTWSCVLSGKTTMSRCMTMSCGGGRWKTSTRRTPHRGLLTESAGPAFSPHCLAAAHETNEV